MYNYASLVLLLRGVCGALGDDEQITCSGCKADLTNDASAIGFKSVSTGDTSTAFGHQTNASGDYSTAFGRATKATGSLSATALGDSTMASGDYSTSLGLQTTAAGHASAAFGEGTTATGAYSTVFGANIESTADEALVNSGSIHGKSLSYVADDRLAAGVQPANSTELLRNIKRLKVVTKTPSAIVCRHEHRTAADCAAAQTAVLLAQQVAKVLPEAVSSASSLDLSVGRTDRTAPAPPGTAARDGRGAPSPERMDAVQSLDVGVLIAQLVGAVQAQASQITQLQQQVNELLRERGDTSH